MKKRKKLKKVTIKKIVALIIAIILVIVAIMLPFSIGHAQAAEKQNQQDLIKEEAVLILVQRVKLDRVTRKSMEHIGYKDFGFYIVLEDSMTMADIAKDINITDEYLLSVNPGAKIDDIVPKGLLVSMPTGDWAYMNKHIYVQVTYGNTLSQLAEYFYTDVESILEQNPKIIDPDLIYVDQVIKIK